MLIFSVHVSAGWVQQEGMSHLQPNCTAFTMFSWLRLTWRNTNNPERMSYFNQCIFPTPHPQVSFIFRCIVIRPKQYHLRESLRNCPAASGVTKRLHKKTCMHFFFNIFCSTPKDLQTDFDVEIWQSTFKVKNNV